MESKRIKKSLKIRRNTSYEGEPLEIKLAKIVETKEPIPMDSPIIFTERKAGVEAQYDIRTDKWEYAQEVAGVQAKTLVALRDNPGLQNKEIGGTPSIHATEGNPQ